MKKCVDYEVEGVRLRGRPKNLDHACEKRLLDTTNKWHC